MLCCGGKSKPESARQSGGEKLDLPTSKVSLKFSNDLIFQLDGNNEWNSSINRRTIEVSDGDSSKFDGRIKEMTQKLKEKRQ